MASVHSDSGGGGPSLECESRDSAFTLLFSCAGVGSVVPSKDSRGEEETAMESMLALCGTGGRLAVFTLTTGWLAVRRSGDAYDAPTSSEELCRRERLERRLAQWRMSRSRFSRRAGLIV